MATRPFRVSQQPQYDQEEATMERDLTGLILCVCAIVVLVAMLVLVGPESIRR